MSGLGAIQSAMVIVPGEKTLLPVTNTTGGTSQGDPNAGQGAMTQEQLADSLVIGTKDKVGASFLTVGLVASLLGSGVFMFVGP